MGSGHERGSDGKATGQGPSGNEPDSQSAAESEDFDGMETTSWRGTAPPVLIEDEEETILSPPPPPELQPGPKEEPDPEVEAESVTLPPALDGEAVDAGAALSSALLGAAIPAASSAAVPEEAETVIAETSPEVATARSIAPSSSLPPMLLQRMEPSMGRGERIRLDVRHWHVRLGRAEENEVRLYTASASRDHALIAGNEDGKWIMTPAEGRKVFVDGEAVGEPMELEVGMNLVFGKDHLRCVVEGLDRREGQARTATEAFENNRRDWAAKLRTLGPLGWSGIVFAGVGLVAFVIWLGA